MKTIERQCECEGSCYDYTVPGYDIVIKYGFVNKVMLPEAKEDDYYIIVCIGEEGLDYYRIFHRISLTEPKYIYGSKPVPYEYRDAIINAINSSYRDGINKINAYNCIDGDKVFDPNIQMPDYNLL